MISQRQIAFRQEYRSRIMGWYDGYFHVAIIYAMGGAAFSAGTAVIEKAARKSNAAEDAAVDEASDNEDGAK